VDRGRDRLGEAALTNQDGVLILSYLPPEASQTSDRADALVSHSGTAGVATVMIPVSAQIAAAPQGSLSCAPTPIDFGLIPRGMATRGFEEVG